MGLLVWSEIPVYWTIAWDDNDTLANARQQLGEEIARDGNRASVILWSVGNETPCTEARTRFLRTLVADARAADPTRLLTAALEHHPAGTHGERIDDPLGADLDVLGLNEYVGWYDGLPAKCDTLGWSAAYDKPIVVSEFGADAKAGMHGDALTRFSEEYQADLYRRQLAMLRRVPAIRGMSPGSWSTFARRADRSPACRTAGTARASWPTTAPRSRPSASCATPTARWRRRRRRVGRAQADARAISASIFARGTAPTIWPTTRPSLKTISVGMARMSSLAVSSLFPSTSQVPTFNVPACASAIAATWGAMARQGGHQAAVKSTRHRQRRLENLLLEVGVGDLHEVGVIGAHELFLSVSFVMQARRLALARWSRTATWPGVMPSVSATSSPSISSSIRSVTTARCISPSEATQPRRRT